VESEEPEGKVRSGSGEVEMVEDKKLKAHSLIDKVYR